MVDKDNLNIISRTNVGSHMWGMERPDSDLDIFEIYLADTRDILLGKQPKSYCYKVGTTEDISGHELGKALQMIMDGNINFVCGVYSPLIIFDSNLFKQFRSIALQNQSQKIYKSVHGMAIHNIKHLKLEGLTEKKAKTILRTIEFGIEFLNGNGAKFRKYDKQLPPDYRSTICLIEGKLKELDNAKLTSPLPELPENIHVANDWLCKLRIKEYDGQI